MSISEFIDHTVLKPTTTLKDIEKLCREAKQFSFAAVCVPPYFVRDAAQALDGASPRLATVIGFPFGYSHYKAKLEETQQALNDGAQEFDMVMNIAAFRSNDLARLENEVGEISRLVEKNKGVLKVIIESGILTDEEIIRCCSLYAHFPVHYMKTSTGYAEKGASAEAVRIMREHLPPSIRIKASGGIKTYAFARQLIDAGASRIGCSASVAIMEEAGQSAY